MAEQELVTELAKNVKGELGKINVWKQEKMRADNLRATSFMENSNKVKKKSTRKLPTNEVYEEIGTGRESNMPSTRRQLVNENRDSQDFLVDKYKRRPTKPAWLPE